MTVTSISLLDRAREDAESDSWDQLVAIYSPLLRRWAARFEVQASDADDLVQEVMVAVARELPGFKHSGRTGAFRKWLRTILVYRLKAFWKARQRRPISSGSSTLLERLDELEDEASSASRIWDDEHDRHVLANLLQQIRPRFQQTTWDAFRRQMFHGEKGRAVADDLGISLKAVQLAKSRVLNALRTEAAGLVDCD